MPEGSAQRCLRPKDGGTEADPTFRLHFLSGLKRRWYPANYSGSSDVYLIVQLGTSVLTFWTPLMRLRCSDWKRR